MNKLKRKYWVIVIAILGFALISAGIMALTNPEIPRYHLGAGGQSTGSGYILTGSIGQHDAGGILSGGEFTLAGGLWGAGGIIDYSIYVPLVMR